MSLLAAQTTVTGQTPAKAKSPIQQKPTRPDDAWWTAQRNIESAINALEKYLRESSNGSHAPAARQQLEALRNLTITQLQPEWVPMRALALPDVPLWRVTNVQQLPDRTRIVLEMKCASEREDCSLKPFRKYPLILLAAGDLYPMLEAGPLPTDIRYARDGTALLAAGRMVSVIVDFAPLQPVAGGRVQFRDDNDATPAKFSLIRRP